VGGITRNRIARLNVNGTLDTLFNPNADNNVNTISLQADGGLLIGGYFTSVGGFARNNLARLLPNGSVDTGFDADANYAVTSTALQPDGKIVIGGDFSTVESVPRALIARLINDPASESLVVANTNRLQWLRGGSAPETQDAIFQLSTNGGASWTFLGAGTRTTGGWECTGLNLPLSGHIRARGRLSGGGAYAESSGVAEKLIAYGGAVSLPEISVEQSGADIVDAGSKDFGTTNRGGVLSLVFTIKNSGLADLVVSGFTLDGANEGEYSVTTGLAGSIVVPNGSTNFTVQFLPNGVGIRTAMLHIVNNDPDENTFDINLSGTVLGPEIVVEQPLGTDIIDGGSKSFGNLTVGSSSSLSFTIKNIGNANLTGLTISKDGTDASIFSVITNPITPVSGPNGSTAFTVRFAPTSLGSKTAAIHIASNDADESPFDITLTGTGVTPSEGWRQTWFSNTANSGNGADLNDFDHDGLSNLLEFATSSNPTATNAPPGQLARNGANMTFTYLRNKAAVSDGVVFSVEWSDTLAVGSWSSAGVTESPIDQGATELVTATLPTGSSGKRFVHLKVTRP
jgi:hypothetical protein